MRAHGKEKQIIGKRTDMVGAPCRRARHGEQAGRGVFRGVCDCVLRARHAGSSFLTRGISHDSGLCGVRRPLSATGPETCPQHTHSRSAIPCTQPHTCTHAHVQRLRCARTQRGSLAWSPARNVGWRARECCNRPVLCASPKGTEPSDGCQRLFFSRQDHLICLSDCLSWFINWFVSITT